MKPNGGYASPGFDGSIITPSHVDGPEIVEAIKSILLRYVIMSEAQSLVCALWIPHTYLFPDYRCSTGYLHVSSPVPECGKSQLLEVLELFVANPLTIGGATPAALIRIIDKESPTLLFDESDLNLHDKEMSALLCGIFNNGWRPGKPYIKCEGEKHEVRKFQVFGAKALAGIGTHYLQPATLTRCFPIRLQRHGAGRMAEEFYFDSSETEAFPIKQKLALWASQRKNHWLKNKRPGGIPGWLNSRKKSIAFPLFAIANDLGGDYTEKLGAALEEIFISAKSGKRLDYKVQLLVDIRSVFDEVESKQEFLLTHELLKGLCEIETSPWAEASNGKPLSPTKLALLLSDFGPAPRQRRVSGDRNLRGYFREDFQEAWTRYLPHAADTPMSDPLHPLQPTVHAGQTYISNPLRDRTRSSPNNAGSTSVYAGCSRCSTLTPGDVGDENKMERELGLPEEVLAARSNGRTLPSCSKCGSYAIYRDGSCQTCRRKPNEH
jgi:hypothetical protein